MQLKSAAITIGMKTEHQTGFTLIELMVAMAVATVVLTVAVPSFREFTRNNRLATQTNQMVTALNLARSEAVKRGVRVTLCTSADTSAEAPSCSESGDWEQGWVVFVDNTHMAGNVPGAIDGTDERLRVFEPLSGNARLAGGSNFQSWISYLPSGTSRGMIGGNADGMFTLCQGSTGSKGKKIVINNTGRVRVEDTTC